MFKFRKKDLVKIVSGKDKGREGEIEVVMIAEQSVIVPGVNIAKRHVKGKPGQKGGIYEIPKPMPLSKILLICPKCKKTTRVGFKFVGDEKVRVCKKCDREIDGK